MPWIMCGVCSLTCCLVTAAASVSSDMSVKLWDCSTQNDVKCVKTLVGHDHSVTGVCFVGGIGSVLSSPSIITCSRDNTIKLWDLESG
jgi:platelet-activating factor acetylhydrolase IB subunit alpha